MPYFRFPPKLGGSSFNPAAPGAIGGTTPAAGAFTTLSSTGNLTLGGLLVGSKQAVSGNGAVTAPNLTTLTTIYTGTSGANLTATLPSGTVDGQIKIISVESLQMTQTMVLTAAMAQGYTTASWSTGNGNASIIIQWDHAASVWVVVAVDYFVGLT